MVWLWRQIRRRGLGSLCKFLGVGIVIITLLQLTTSAPHKEFQQLPQREIALPPAAVHKDNEHTQQRGPPVQQQKQAEHKSLVDFDDDNDHQKPKENAGWGQPKESENAPQRVFPQQRQEGPKKAAAQNSGQSGVGQQQQGQEIPNQNGNRGGIDVASGTSSQKKDRTTEFYRDIFVHFDLKGAPPKVPYFLELLHLIANSGATGVMIEWEDMFPFTGPLSAAVNVDAYSMDDVKTILSKAQSLGLQIVPLVQTFAHLEWILKLEEFRKHRSADEYPQALCLQDQEGVNLVKDALKQVIDAHKPFGIPFFHIGCDEVFMYAVCQADVQWIRNRGADGSKELLALTHMKDIAQYVKEHAGQTTTVLAWHDMLKNFPTPIVKRVDIGNLIEPVVWDYSEGIVTMNEWSFQTLADGFSSVWASSAYKGANFPSAKYIDVGHYEKNNRAWVDVIKSNKERFKKGFRGIIITGWQRYDHMTALCEILPMGTPSMVLQIETALSAGNKEDQRGIRRRAAKKLGCSGETFAVAGLDLINNQCNFSGWNAYAVFQRDVRRTIEYVEIELEKHHPTIGWLNEYNERHEFTQNWYLREIMQFLEMQKAQLVQVERQLRTHLSAIFFDNTVEEYIFLTIGRPIEKITRMLSAAEKLGKLRVWPKRNFAIKKDEL